MQELKFPRSHSINTEMGLLFRCPHMVERLRRAFEATMKDADFLAESARAQQEIEPLTGAYIDKLLASAYSAPKDIVQRAAQLIEPGAQAR